MAQPPHPPQGGNEPGGDEPGAHGWHPPDGANEPTQQFGSPGEAQREPTQQFGQPPYGQPPYGQPGQPWGAGPGGQQPKGNKNTLIAMIIAGVVVLAAIGVALFLLLGNDDTTSTASSATAATRSSAGSSSASSSSSGSPGSSAHAGSGIPPASIPPDGLGDDPVLDRYAQSCYDGDMEACDILYNESEVNSTYETYGGTCAGRQPPGDSDVVYCADAFPG